MSGQKQKAKTYSLIILSDATSSSRTFSVSAKLVRRGIVAVFVFFLLFGFMLFHYLSITLDKQKMKQMMIEKKKNDREMVALRDNVAELTKSLQEMDIMKTRILVAIGLTQPNALQEVGSGGPPMTEEAADAEQFQLPDGLRASPSRPSEPSPQQLVENARRMQQTLGQALQFTNNQIQRNASIPSVAPVRGFISSAYSYRTNPFTQAREFHGALDIASQLGNPVIAPADGTVFQAETVGGYGKTLVLDHNASGFLSRFAHLSNFNVRVGQKVKRYDVIGYVGSTGMSTSPHLHYEVQYLGKTVNPFYFILDWGK